jgi:hypothetical protein
MLGKRNGKMGEEVFWNDPITNGFETGKKKISC